MARQDNQGSKSRRSRGKRVTKRHAFGLFLLVTLLLGIVFLPKLATSRAVLPRLVDRFAGIAPLQLEVGAVDAGWFRPVRAHDIRLLDDKQNVLAQIGEIQTEKGILGWITNSSDLGLIKVHELESAIVAYNGTTNLESALGHLTQAETVEAPAETAGVATHYTGRIEVTNSRIVLAEANRPEQWVMEIPRVSLELPSAGQLTGPVEVQATLSDRARGDGRMGLLAAAVEQSASSGAFEVRMKLEEIPLEFWHVVQARMPQMPIEQLQGEVSAVVAGQLVDDSTWSLDIQELSGTELSVLAPEFVGPQAANLKSVVGSARCTLSNSVLKLENTSLQCDFANATAVASIPWPIKPPTAAEPFIEGANLTAQGSVDLPRLVAAAQGLVPIRENTQLVSGNAQFTLTQETDAAGYPTSRVNLKLDDLEATTGTQQIVWKEPLEVALAANRTVAGQSFGVATKAEFLQLEGGGTIENGKLAGSVDLSLLQQRLSGWMDLPIQHMTGAANTNISWSKQSDNSVRASGTINTTPVQLLTSANHHLNEPAWNGDFQTRVSLNAASPERIENAKLVLQSEQERIVFELKEPLHLQTPPAADEVALANTQLRPNASRLAPASFSIDIHADLQKCSQRSTVWMVEKPELELGGNLSLALNGRMDLSHVEIFDANWSSQPIRVATPQMQFSEPQMVGKFAGRIDTNDLTRLVVQTLQVQSTSFSIGAQDSAAPDGSGARHGRAVFIADLGRLMQNVGNAQVLPPGGEAAASSALSATGVLNGELNWQVSSTAATANTRIVGQNIVLLSHSAGQPNPTPLWQEPSVETQVVGAWKADTGAFDVPQLELSLPWMKYKGGLSYQPANPDRMIQLQGQAVYDAAQLGQKLTPYTGGQVQLAGQQTVPVQLVWGSSEADATFAGLHAKTRIGWEQASVAGIAVGKADVPISIDRGLLTTAAEIPVSGGALRWDISSDLTADEIVLHQKPMTVLENVALTEQMCQGWLKYVAPLLAEATSVDGRLSLHLDHAELSPADPYQQTVNGRLVVHNATVGPGPLSNQVITLAKQIDAIRKKQYAQAVSSTQKVWMTLPEQLIDFQMINGNVIHRNLSVRIGDANISTAGQVNVDGQMNMMATMPIPDDWAAKDPLLAGLRGQSLQFPIHGTLSSPQVDTQLLQQLGQKTVENAATGLLQQGLNKGLEKLLGGPDAMNAIQQPGANQPTPGSNQQGNTRPVDPIQGLGEQILGGQGINLPGLFPGLGGSPPNGN